jgi:hypothetical protein
MPVGKKRKRERKLIHLRTSILGPARNLERSKRHEKYLEFIQGLRIEFDFKNYPNYVFFFRGIHCPIQYNLKTQHVYLSKEMWTNFADDVSLEHKEFEIRMFISNLLQEYFGLRVFVEHSPYVRFENFKFDIS